MIRLAIAVSLVAVPVCAENLAFSPEATETCLAAGEAFEACVGASANACVETNGYATVVMSACAAAEAEWWDGRLNAAYQRAMAQAKELDAENGDYAPSQADALRDMQRAWIPYRDATCSYEASQWGGGTGSGPAYANCLMQQTARQTLYLETAGLN